MKLLKQYKIEDESELLPIIDCIEETRVKYKIRIILLEGELGSGKTTFVKHFLNKIYDVKEAVTSPTFTIVNEYVIDNQLILHFDLYRLKDEFDLVEIGFDEYLNKSILCFIEWSAIAHSILDEFLPLIVVKFVKQDTFRTIDVLLIDDSEEDN
ncbi:MAG: tRNA (adenosine(37)-N6)-threonylcarbamoyltransferase complex ATPase subunit type 1 TsaE [Bacteroidota bacterium]|nr:tRNA (adenosine(37)-N6)-threonylcarbamoyltransferase complex ATPase subunit type 1 TsaE [Bacteroidota bacterium]